MADFCQLPPPEPQLGVVIVQIRHPLAFPAAEFSNVVPRRAAGYQRQIHRHAGFFQCAPRRHGNVMHPRNVFQRLKGRYLQPQTHHLINIFPLPKPQHLVIGHPAGTALPFLIPQKGKIPHGIKGKLLPFTCKKHLQNREKEHRASVPDLLGPLLFRKGLPPGKAECVGKPSFLRLAACQP